jgi:aspartate/methionine/tyrosine aminotransferase
MNYAFAELMSGIKSSATVTLADKCRRLRESGEDIIDLTIGEPDFPTPAHIIDAAYEAAKKGETKYTASLGISALRKAISAKLQRDYHTSYDPDTEIIVTPGGKQGIMYAILALINPGDEVLCLEPCWVGYESCVALAQGKFVGLKTHASEGYAVTEDVLERAVTPKTRLLVINSPCNPTGKVLTRDEIAAIGRVCIKHDLMLLSDDIYEKIVYDRLRFESALAVDGLRERTIILNGFSKAYSMTGWRLAYLAADSKIIREVNKLQQLSATCPSSVSQWAGVEALNGPQDGLTEMVRAYQRRRDLIVDGFNNGKLKCFKPQGAFYGFVDVSGIAATSAAASELLLEKCRIMSVPGDAFGGPGYVRVSFGTSDENLRKAIKNLEKL